MTECFLSLEPLQDDTCQVFEFHHSYDCDISHNYNNVNVSGDVLEVFKVTGNRDDVCKQLQHGPRLQVTRYTVGLVTIV